MRSSDEGGAAEWRPPFFGRFRDLRVGCIVAGVDGGPVFNSLAALAAKKTTETIPIVMIASDPIGQGLVASLSRPGGNLTGLNVFNEAISGKRLQILKELLPELARVAVLRNPLVAPHAIFWQETEAAARKLGVALQPLEVRRLDDFETAFETAKRGDAQALLAFDDPLHMQGIHRIVDLAASNRLPAMYPNREFPVYGGLMSYGPNVVVLFRRAATFVDKILKGANPADLPVEQPTKFELVINLKTAKALGLIVPPALLAQADEVIE